MYSLNAPVPPAVREVAADLDAALAPFEWRREDPSILVKRLDPDDRAAAGLDSFARIAERARDVLAGAPACAARLSGIGVFEHPPAGSAPVVYLAVESPGLHRLHRELSREFRPIPEIEGEGYVPHVTLARDGPPEAAERLATREVPPVEWVVDELVLYDARHKEPVRRYALPA